MTSGWTSDLESYIKDQEKKELDERREYHRQWRLKNPDYSKTKYWEVKQKRKEDPEFNKQYLEKRRIATQRRFSDPFKRQKYNEKKRIYNRAYNQKLRDERKAIKAILEEECIRKRMQDPIK